MTNRKRAQSADGDDCYRIMVEKYTPLNIQHRDGATVSQVGRIDTGQVAVSSLLSGRPSGVNSIPSWGWEQRSGQAATSHVDPSRIAVVRNQPAATAIRCPCYPLHSLFAGVRVCCRAAKETARSAMNCGVFARTATSRVILAGETSVRKRQVRPTGYRLMRCFVPDDCHQRPALFTCRASKQWKCATQGQTLACARKIFVH